MKIDQSVVSLNGTSASVQQGMAVGRMEAPTTVQRIKQPVNQKAASPITKRDSTEAEHILDKQSGEHDRTVIQAIEKANKHFRTYDRRLEFSIHEATKKIMVKVINTEDDEIIREIPSEKVLDMVAHLWEMAGILIDEQR